MAAILTNGCLLNGSLLELLKEYRDTFIVQICLAGSTPEKVEKTTGIKGSFSKIVRAIENLSREGINVRVGMVIDALEKLDDIENTLILAKNSGAKFFSVSTALPLGRGRNLNLQFREEDFPKLENLFKYLNKKYPSFLTSEEKPLIEDLGNRDSINCGAGYRSIVIGSNGKIRPCALSSDEFGIIGEIKYDGIIEMSHSITTLFSKLEAPDKETCNNCKYLSYCYKCIVRGLNKLREIGEESCNWRRKNDIIIEELKKVEIK